MPESILEKLDKGSELLYKGKIKEVFQLVGELNKEESLTQEERLSLQLVKGLAYGLGGRYEKALRAYRGVSRRSRNLGYVPLTINAILSEWLTLISVSWVNFGEIKSWKVIEDEANLLKSAKRYPPSEIDIGKSLLHFMKGLFYWDEGDLDHAIKYLKKNLEITDKYNNSRLLLLKPHIFALLGNFYTEKGELELALKYHNLSLDSTEESNLFGLKSIRAFSFSQIGDIHYQRGDFDLTVEYYKKSLKVREELNVPAYLCEIYYRFVKIFIVKGDYLVAQEYLKRFQKYLEKENITNEHALKVFPPYKLSVALVLKSNKRIRDRAEAEMVLKELIELDEFAIWRWGLTTSSGTSAPHILPIIELCDLYLQELDIFKDLEIIDEIRPLIERLLNESKHMNSFSLQAYAVLLLGKISLLQLNMGETRQYLTQAQRIAEENGLQLLARQISSEHDRLLELVDELQQIERKKASVTERINLASLDITLEQLQGKRSLDPPEMVEEEPILLLIMGRDGISYLNHPFVDNWNFEDLFGSFMSAFNSFSGEIFSESIDRIKIGNNVILIKPVESFLICYVIRGQSYSALQKLSRFSDAIKWKTEIWDTLNRSIETSEMLTLKNPSSLGDVVNEIFYQ